MMETLHGMVSPQAVRGQAGPKAGGTFVTPSWTPSRQDGEDEALSGQRETSLS